MRLTLCMIGIAICSVSSASAEVTLQSGTMEVQLQPGSYAWTGGDIAWNGKSFADFHGTGVASIATVIQSDGHWIGIQHGGETILDASVTVDGSSVPLSDGQSYQGNRITFHRHTDLGGIMELQADTIIQPNSIFYDVTLQATEAGHDLSVCYIHQGMRMNRLTLYASYDQAGQLLDQGSTAGNDNSFRHLDGSVAVAQYDPVSQNGMIQVLMDGRSFNSQQLLWDRSIDNKFYQRLREMEHLTDPAEIFRASQCIRFFEAPPNEWQDVAASLIPAPGDCDADGDVDPEDLACIGLHYSPDPSGRCWREGNFDDDGDIDSEDLAALGLHWSPGGGATRVPEPASVLTLAAGLGWLLRTPRHRHFARRK